MLGCFKLRAMFSVKNRSLTSITLVWSLFIFVIIVIILFSQKDRQEYLEKIASVVLSQNQDCKPNDTSEQSVTRHTTKSAADVSPSARNPLSVASSQSRMFHVVYIHQIDATEKLNQDNFAFFMNFAYVPCSSRIFFSLLFTKNNLKLSSNFSDFNKNTNESMKQVDITPQLIELIGANLTRKLLKCLIPNNNIGQSFGQANTKILFVENRPGSDLCAYEALLSSSYWTENERLFYYVFFINSSVRGPFLPLYYFKPWWEMFSDVFDHYPNDTVAVGPYLSCEPSPHVQSFFICVDPRGLEILKQIFRCMRPNESLRHWVVDTEVRLGNEWLKRGYSMRSLLAIYGGMGTQGQIKGYNCHPGINPTTVYPLSDSDKNSLITLDDEAKKGEFVINVYEVVWVKYNKKFPMSQYTKKYVPLYTSFAYKNLARGFHGRSPATYNFQEYNLE